MATGFSVKVFGVGVWGVHLRGSLSGPQPWHIKGSASIELLFFDISVDVDVTFGDEGGVILPPIALLPPLLEEFKKAESWVAGTAGFRQPADDAPKARRGEPAGAAPRGGAAREPADGAAQRRDQEGRQPGDERRQEGAASRFLAGRSPCAMRRARCSRAASIQDLSDADKLSKPAFESMEGGVQLAGSGADWATGVGADRNVRYESIIVDTLFERFARAVLRVDGAAVRPLPRPAAPIAKSALSHANEKRRSRSPRRSLSPATLMSSPSRKDNTQRRRNTRCSRRRPRPSSSWQTASRRIRRCASRCT